MPRNERGGMLDVSKVKGIGPKSLSLLNKAMGIDIYDKIQEKYPKRVIKSTVINYIRSELQKTDGISIENSDWIVFQLENLLNERE